MAEMLFRDRWNTTQKFDRKKTPELVENMAAATAKGGPAYFEDPGAGQTR